MRKLLLRANDARAHPLDPTKNNARTARAGQSEFSRETQGQNQRIAGRAGVKAQHQQDVGRDKRKAKRAAFRFRGRDARAPRKHHQQSEVLPGVVPRTPANVQRENPGKQPVPDVRDDSCYCEQQRHVHRVDPVFLELIARVIRAINRSHEVRIVGEQGEKIKCDAPASLIRIRKIKSCEQEWRGPGSAADRQINPRTINPRTLRTRRRSGRRSALLWRSDGDCSHAIAE